MTSLFKVGDKVRRTFGHNSWHQEGYEGVVSAIRGDELVFPDGTWGLAERFTLVSPIGPVVTETVTKTRIVPGVYGVVQVLSERNGATVQVLLCNTKDVKTWYTAEELKAAAAVLIQLAGALEE